MAWTNIDKPSTSYQDTPLWSGAYLPWLITSFPWLKTETTQASPTYTGISKPSTIYTNINKPA